MSENEPTEAWANIDLKKKAHWAVYGEHEEVVRRRATHYRTDDLLEWVNNKPERVRDVLFDRRCADYYEPELRRRGALP